MSTLSDLDLVKLIQTDDKAASAAITELVARHGGLYTSTVHNVMQGQPNTRLSISDAISEMPTFFFEAAKSFDPGRGMSFSTYLAQLFKWDHGKLYKSQKVELNSVGGLKELDTYGSTSDEVEEEDSEVYTVYNAALAVIDNPRDLQIFKLRFGPDNMTHEEVGDIVGLSKQRVQKIEAAWLVKIRAHFNRKV